jgi:beta-glucosidase
MNRGLIFTCIAYTTFKYSTLATAVNVAPGPTTGKTIVGGPEDLFDIVGTVSAYVRNSGRVTGAEVAQLYIGYPDSAPSTPPKQLRGFSKINLVPGQSGQAIFELRRRDISYWDVATQKWVVPQGKFKVYVGSSSRDIRLKGSFTV